jgi:hypothetical protein
MVWLRSRVANSSSSSSSSSSTTTVTVTVTVTGSGGRGLSWMDISLALGKAFLDPVQCHAPAMEAIGHLVDRPAVRRVLDSALNRDSDISCN